MPRTRTTYPLVLAESVGRVAEEAAAYCGRLLRAGFLCFAAFVYGNDLETVRLLAERIAPGAGRLRIETARKLDSTKAAIWTDEIEPYGGNVFGRQPGDQAVLLPSNRAAGGSRTAVREAMAVGVLSGASEPSFLRGARGERL